MKYIDSEKLKAEIERRIKSTLNISHIPCHRREELEGLLSFVGSLQQEQPEVDLNKEINRFLSNATIMNKGRWKGKYPISEMGFGVVAHHFFNLGLNARKA